MVAQDEKSRANLEKPRPNRETIAQNLKERR